MAVQPRSISLIAVAPAEARFVDLIFAGDQEKFWLHFNHYWRDNAARVPGVECRWIEASEPDEDLDWEGPIGFCAFGDFFEDEELTKSIPGSLEIIHFVIHRQHQRRGFGLAATLEIIRELLNRDDCERIMVAHHPDNLAASKLYNGLGFSLVGENYDGDPLYAMTKTQAIALIEQH